MRGLWLQYDAGLEKSQQSLIDKEAIHQRKTFSLISKSLLLGFSPFYHINSKVQAVAYYVMEN